MRLHFASSSFVDNSVVREKISELPTFLLETLGLVLVKLQGPWQYNNIILVFNFGVYIGLKLLANKI